MAAFKIATFNPKYLSSGDTWNVDENLGVQFGFPVALSYTYLTSLPDYYSGAGWVLNNLPPLGSTQTFVTTSGIFSAYNIEQQRWTDKARDMWSNYTNITWNEVVQGAGTPTVGKITFGNYAFTDPDLKDSDANTMFPHPSVIFPNQSLAPEIGGDIFLNTNGPFPAIHANPTMGSYGYHTILHELGHALGLVHAQFPDLTGFATVEAVRVPFNEDEKWLRLFEQLSPIYKWNPGGLISA